MARRTNFKGIFGKADMYAEKVGVKMDGKPSVKSKTGACITMITVIAILAFCI